jgi:hypothetical protein
VRIKPALDGFHREHLIVNVGLRQLQQACDRRIARYERLVAFGGGPKGVGVFRQVPVRIFNGRLGFTNAAQTAQRSSALSDERLLELR